MRHAAAADGILDVPLDAKDVDTRVLRDATVQDVDQAPHASVARGGAEILVTREIDTGWAESPLAHVVVGGRDDLLDAAARVGELGHVAEIDRRDLGRRSQGGERVTVASERADPDARGHELTRYHSSELTRSADDEHSRFGHCSLRAAA